MTDETIKKIYANTVKFVLNGIDEESKELISYYYFSYLYKIYKNFDIKNRNVEKVIQIFSNLEISKWQNMNAIAKKEELIKDNAFESIKAISGIALDYAKQKINTRDINNENMQDTLDRKKADEYINELNAYLQQVKDFNKQIAIYYVSEGIMDLDFASGKTKNTSLRIGRIIK